MEAAGRGGSIPIIQKMMSLGATSYFTTFESAIQSERLDVIQFLLSLPNREALLLSDITDVLLEVVSGGNLDIIKLIATPANAKQILGEAAAGGQFPIVEYICQHFPQLELEEEFNYPIQNFYPEIFDLLLDHYGKSLDGHGLACLLAEAIDYNSRYFFDRIYRYAPIPHESIETAMMAVGSAIEIQPYFLDRLLTDYTFTRDEIERYTSIAIVNRNDPTVFTRLLSLQYLDQTLIDKYSLEAVRYGNLRVLEIFIDQLSTFTIRQLLIETYFIPSQELISALLARVKGICVDEELLVAVTKFLTKGIHPGQNSDNIKLYLDLMDDKMMYQRLMRDLIRHYLQEVSDENIFRFILRTYPFDLNWLVWILKEVADAHPNMSGRFLLNFHYISTMVQQALQRTQSS
jgi:hypothetical protein